jgi:hypothetical protein
MACCVLAGLLGCERKPVHGFLKVEAPGAGSYEIYRIANESPLQFVSELAGRFNEDVALAPGSYLVLADCSSETVIIYPGEHEKLVAHRIAFVTPHPPGPEDGFSIQCSRSDKTKSRQSIVNRYELNVIHGKRDLLVGMVPMHIDFTAMPEPEKQKTLSYKLSALQVADFEGNKQQISYFVSPEDELIAATKYQSFGHWEFLLPGRYTMEVNGTRMQVDLAEGEERTVKPALLKVTTSPEIDLDQPARVKGSPWLVEINSDHWLNFNETYPVLPGTATIAISGSTRSVEVVLEEGKQVELKTRSVTIDSLCSQDPNASCLGNRAVSLYLPEEPYPFMESVSDIPILFIDQNMPVLVGVEGSRDIVYTIPANVRDKTLQLGYAHIVPEAQHKPGQLTDLLRVEALNAPASGHTLDVSLERPTLMPLISGTYQLDHFLTFASSDADRRGTERNFVIEPGKTVELELTVYLSEKKYQALKKKQATAAAENVKSVEFGNYKHAPRTREL